ncbi:MAG TPA: type II toxin-antitoxin system RelE/ParE family toxin [Verrucomicrobiae bacterium]|jgi:mRNA interferase RelE/StbE|nr:type II toxin-antitoxin system RelE/ParE family toxin [Verrucomicrobiae bacterium]
MYRIELTHVARKALLSIPAPDQQRVARAIDGLAQNPRPPGVKKLSGGAGEFRLRVGAHRVIYEVFDDVLRVLVLAIGPRKDVYRRR